MTTYEGSKLNATHLERAAVVYVRQSTDFQVHNHVERQRLQYELTTHAKELGFRTVTVIDDDLGTSASGVHRPGFEKYVVQPTMSGSTRNPLSTRDLSPNCLTLYLPFRLPSAARADRLVPSIAVRLRHRRGR